MLVTLCDTEPRKVNRTKITLTAKGQLSSECQEAGKRRTSDLLETEAICPFRLSTTGTGKEDAQNPYPSHRAFFTDKRRWQVRGWFEHGFTPCQKQCLAGAFRLKALGPRYRTAERSCFRV